MNFHGGETRSPSINRCFFPKLHVLSRDFSKCKPEGYVIPKLSGLSSLRNKHYDKLRYLECKRKLWVGRKTLPPLARLEAPLVTPSPSTSPCLGQLLHPWLLGFSVLKLPPTGHEWSCVEFLFVGAASMKQVSPLRCGSGSPSSHQTPCPCPSDSHH